MILCLSQRKGPTDEDELGAFLISGDLLPDGRDDATAEVAAQPHPHA
jgi:hypothetical protein